MNISGTPSPPGLWHYGKNKGITSSILLFDTLVSCRLVITNAKHFGNYNI